MISIYVLPTTHGIPPQAVVGEVLEDEEGTAIVGSIATWSADMGVWVMEGTPVPPELGDAITEHAKALGVEW